MMIALWLSGQCVLFSSPTVCVCLTFPYLGSSSVSPHSYLLTVSALLSAATAAASVPHSHIAVVTIGGGGLVAMATYIPIAPSRTWRGFSVNLNRFPPQDSHLHTYTQTQGRNPPPLPPKIPAVCVRQDERNNATSLKTKKWKTSSGHRRGPRAAGQSL